MAAFTERERAAVERPGRILAMPAGPERVGQVCASECEKNKLAALTAGLAITMLTWIAVLSFLPRLWFDSLTSVSYWVFAAASVALWSIAGLLAYLVLGAKRQKRVVTL